MPEREVVEIGVVGNMVSTTITLDNGQSIRVLASERAIVKQILAYRKALDKLRGTDHADAAENGPASDVRPD